MSSEPKNPKKKPVITHTAANEIAADLLRKSGEYMESKQGGYDFVKMDGSNDPKKKIIVPRQAFVESPNAPGNYQGIKNKRKLLPDEAIKEIRTSSHLVASILRARGNQLSAFGKLVANRFDVGYKTAIKPQFEKELTTEQLVKVQNRIARFNDILNNCGKNEGIPITEKMTFSTYLYLTSINMVSFGRAATEIVYDNVSGEESEENGKFHRFRPVDVGTIGRTVKEYQSDLVSVRNYSAQALSRQQETPVTIETDLSERYPWVQMLDGGKKQYFSDKELLVYQLYPSTDIEHNGYPVTPIDTALSSITTHLSIEAYNKLYFQNGRAAKGMLVINSDQIDQDAIEAIKQEYQASINDVTNSFRTPIMGVTAADTVQWISTQGDGKDGEFQFLYDQIARNILSSFNMSPDELPGFGHLSRGSNQQTLSESSGEFKLTAARDTGIRPLILRLQDFLNELLFPMIDPELSQLCFIELCGIDAQSRDQEAVRLAQEAPIHMTQNEIQTAVDKEIYPKALSGEFPLSERYQLLLDKYHTVGELLEFINGNPSAFVDPLLKYRRDGFFLQNLQMVMQINPSAVQALFSTSPMHMELFKLSVQDYLDEIEED